MNKGISEIKRIGYSSKEQLDSLSNSIIKSVNDGSFSAVETISLLKKMQSLCETVTNAIKPNAIDELDNYDKVSIVNGVVFEKAEVGTKYDYSNCNHFEYNELVEKIKGLNEERKNIENMLKTIGKSNKLMNTEGVEYAPPIKTSTSSFKLKLK